jgi:chemotaxis signal transduction protein
MPVPDMRQRSWEARVLDERGRRLAARGLGQSDQTTTKTHSLLVWEEGNELYGIRPEEVRAVLPYAGCMPIISRQPSCIGVLGWMGAIYSVIDSARLFQTSTEQPSDGHLLLLTHEKPCIGLRVSQVSGLVSAALGSNNASALIAEGPHELSGRPVSPVDIAFLVRRLGLPVPILGA